MLIRNTNPVDVVPQSRGMKIDSGLTMTARKGESVILLDLMGKNPNFHCLNMDMYLMSQYLKLHLCKTQL